MYSRKLTYFLKICETGSLSRASEALFISQQALSKAIDALEDELGVPLFVRTPKGLTLTQYGEALREDAWDLKKRQERLTARIASMKAAERQSVSMSFFAGMIGQYPNDFFEGFMREHPEARYHFYSYSDDATGRRFANTDVDLFFSTCPLQLNSMELVYELNVPLDLLVSREHPLAQKGVASMDDFRGGKFIVTNADLAARNHIQRVLSDHGIRISCVLSNAEQSMMNFLILERGAVSFFAGPDSMMPEGTARIRLTDNPVMFSNYYYARKSGISPIARQLLDKVIAFRTESHKRR